MILGLLAAISLVQSTPMENRTDLVEPTVNLSAIRSLVCTKWAGSGFIIGPHILATALHVAKNTKCIDVATGARLELYKEDDKHDLALMTSLSLPTDTPYIKYSCARFKTGASYFSYGITFYGQPYPIFRMNKLVATKNYTTILDYVGWTSSPGMRIFTGAIAPGVSGGPALDENGYAHAVNNAGSDKQTLLYEFADGMLCK